MKEYKLTKKQVDQRGSLSVCEFKDLPVNIKRVYFISGVSQNGTRGKHAHKQTVQFAQCLKGSCDITLDNKEKKETIRLRPERGILLLDKMVWHTAYNFTPDCMLAVYSSDEYREEDYIRDYSEFLHAT